MKKPAIPGQFTSLRLFMDKLLAVTMQLKMGSATVPVAAVGSRRAGTAPNGIGAGPRNVFGQRPKTAGATPALPKATASFRLSVTPVGRRQDRSCRGDDSEKGDRGQGWVGRSIWLAEKRGQIAHEIAG